MKASFLVYRYFILSSLVTRRSLYDALSLPNPTSQKLIPRREALRQALLIQTTAQLIPAKLAYSLDEHDNPRKYVTVTITSPTQQLGLEIYDTLLRNKNVVAIRKVVIPSNLNTALQEGMILDEFASVKELQQVLEKGPFPLQLKFVNLSTGGDAFSDLGTSIVTSPDAVELTQQTKVTKGGSSIATTQPGYSITTVYRPLKMQCAVESSRGDVLEIDYEASYITKEGKTVVYDASSFRGTGQPYQLVLGNGDMIPGVDQGLYGMCPGEERVLHIPPILGYSSLGTRIFRIPPDYNCLLWKVRVVSIDSIIQNDNNNMSRQERESVAL